MQFKICILSCLTAAMTCAQVAPGLAPRPATAAPAPAADKPLKIGNVVLNVTLRSRVYAWDWFQAPTGENQYGYSGNLLRLGFSEKYKTWDWNAEIAVPFFLGLPKTATLPAPQGALGLGSNYYTANHNSSYAAGIYPRQLFARFHGESKTQSFMIGRMEFVDGGEIAPRNATLVVVKRDRINQRLIGPFGFTDAMRSFDGLRYSWNKPTSDFTAFAAVPTRGVFQTDGWGWNRAAVVYTSFTHEWGSKSHAADTRVFFIDYTDFRHIVKSDNRPAAVRAADLENIHIETFGGHSIHTLESNSGIFDFVIWGAVQTGSWGNQKQRSYAFDFEEGFQPKILPHLKPWVRGGMTYGSGDDTPNDATHGTFFQILPTPRPYARTPFFNMMNNNDRWLGLILRPHPKVTISDEFHALRLASSTDLWYSGGGLYQPWTFGFTGRNTSGRRSLANLYDLNIEYRMNRRVTLTAYVGYAQGFAAMKQIYASNKDARLGMLEMLFRR